MASAPIDHALDDGMRTALHGGAVHERAGVALVAVADDVLGEVVVAGGRAPLAPRGKARAALAAQAGLLDFGDDFVRRHGKRPLEALVAAARTVGVEVERVDDADVGQDDLVLHGVEGVVGHVVVELAVLVVEQALDRIAVERGDDGGRVFDRDVVVHEVARHEAHDRPAFAFARAARAHGAHLRVLAGLRELCLDGICHLEGAVGNAACAAAHEDLFDVSSHCRSSRRQRTARQSFSPARRAACCGSCRPRP